MDQTYTPTDNHFYRWKLAVRCTADLIVKVEGLRETNPTIVDKERVGFVVRDGRIKVSLILGKKTWLTSSIDSNLIRFGPHHRCLENIGIALIWQQYGLRENTPNITLLIPCIGPAFSGSMLYYGVVTN
jgi:hypothetical protein